MVGAGATGGEKGHTDRDAQTHGHENGKDDDHPGPRHACPAPGEDAKDQGHEQEACGQEYHLAADRGFQEGLVDHDRADDAKVYAGKSFFRLCCDDSREFGNLGHGLQQALLRQFNRDVYDADMAVQGEDAACYARVGQSDGTDVRPRFGSAQFLRIDKIAHIQLIAVGRRVLKVGERVDAPRIWCLPGGLCEPDGGRECVLRRGIAIVRNNQENDVLVLPVGALQRFQCQKLRIVLVEEDTVVGGKFELSNTYRRDCNQKHRCQDDYPASREHPFRESRCELLSCHVALVHRTEATNCERR